MATLSRRPLQTCSSAAVPLEQAVTASVGRLWWPDGWPVESARLGIQPSRMVTLLDDLEQRGFVERRVNPDDRRARLLHLTPAGTTLLGEVNVIGLEHESETCAALTGEQRGQLLALLQLVAAVPGAIEVHPGLRRS